MWLLVLYFWLRVGVSIEQTKRCVVACIVILAVLRFMCHMMPSSAGIISVQRSPKATDFTQYPRCTVRAAARDQGSMALDI